MTEAERAARLAEAGYQVLNLDGADVEVDLFTDIPPRAYDAEVRAAGVAACIDDAREPDLSGLAERIYGPALYVPMAKGRSAEHALVAALARPGMMVVAHPLFMSTMHALAVNGARVEIAPVASEMTSDLDLAWLERRLAAGGVDALYLEASTNGLGGRPLTVEGFAAAAAIARRSGARVFLDATRLLANAHALGSPVLGIAQQFTRLADAFTVGGSKELLTPYGALVGVRERALQLSVFHHALLEGGLLEPLDARVRLARGLSVMAERADEILGERARQLRLFAEALRAAGVAVREPLGGHALYLPVDRLHVTDELHARALEGLLYTTAGVRSVLFPLPALPGHTLRLALPIGRYSDETLTQAAAGIARFCARAEETPRLRPRPDGGRRDHFAPDLEVAR